MSEEDLMNLLGSDMQLYMKSVLNDYIIIVIYFIDDTIITIGSGGVRKSNVSCNPKALEVQYDSHKTDYLYDSMVRIEKYA